MDFHLFKNKTKTIATKGNMKNQSIFHTFNKRIPLAKNFSMSVTFFPFETKQVEIKKTNRKTLVSQAPNQTSTFK